MYPKNNASPEPIAIGAVVQISDGAVQTSGVTVRIKPIGVAEGDGAGTTAYSTDGIVEYIPTQAETNYTSFILIAKKTGCIPVAVTVVTTASGTPGYAGLDWAKITSPTTTVGLSGTTVKTATDVETDTQDIQSRIPAALGANGNIKSDVRDLLGTAWLTPGTAGTPDVNVKLWNALATVALPLVPTVAGRTLDVSAGGEAGLDWANVGTPSSTVNLSATTINLVNTATTVTNQLTTAQIATGVWTDTTAGDFTTALSIGKSIMNGVSLGTGLTVNTLTNAPSDSSGTTTLLSRLTALRAGYLDNINNVNLATTIAQTGDTYALANGASGFVAIAGYIDTEVAAIKAKTDNLPASPAAVGSAMTLTSAYDFAKGTVAVTESYSADGAAPTPVQALLLVMQALTEGAISGTTWTIKKLDGSTTAATITLDSSSTPTSKTRAT